MIKPTHLLLAGGLVLASASSALATVVLSTDYSGMDQYPSSGDSGTLTWTKGDPSLIDLPTADSTFDGATFEPGHLYTFDGDYNSEGIRRAGGNPQFNSVSIGRTGEASPDNVAVFAFTFEVQAGQSAEIDNASFTLGTASTSGGALSISGTDNLGKYNVEITDGTDTWSFFSSDVALPTTGDSLPSLTATPDSTISLGAGVYRLSILHIDKADSGNASQRTTLVDNLSLAVVPEPSTYALMLGGLALAGVMLRRRRRG